MCEIAVEAHGLTKRYGNLVAVNDVNLEIKKGAIVGLVGKNGAGKTTLIRMLTGLVKPTEGTFSLLSGSQRKANSVAAIVESPALYQNFSAMQNLRAQCILTGVPADDEFLQLTLKVVGLNPTSKQRAKFFSRGMKQRLTMAMTFVGKPELMFLDEPTDGLDPQGIFEMREAFVRLNTQFGTTIVISGHILSELSKFVTEYYFLDKGKVVRHAYADEIARIAAKRLRITVDNAEKALEVLQSFGNAQVFKDNTVELLGEALPSDVLLALAQNGVNVSDFQSVGDGLEQFFLELIGGAR